MFVELGCRDGICHERHEVAQSLLLGLEAGDRALLTRLVEKLSGVKIDDYFVKEITGPLGMLSTIPHEGRLETTINDLSHLAIALVCAQEIVTGSNGEAHEPVLERSVAAKAV